MRGEEQNMRSLSRSERLYLRNQSMLTKLATGTTKEQLRQEYCLSTSQLNRIIAEGEIEAQEWYKNLPKKHLLHLFQNTADKIQQKINRMEFLASKFKDSEEEFDYDERIINSYTKFMNLLADGPAFVRSKEILEEAEDFLKKHHLNHKSVL